MKAVISVIGKDKVGILAMIANECANYNLNVLDVTQGRNSRRCGYYYNLCTCMFHGRLYGRQNCA